MGSDNYLNALEELANAQIKSNGEITQKKLDKKLGIADIGLLPNLSDYV